MFSFYCRHIGLATKTDKRIFGVDPKLHICIEHLAHEWKYCIIVQFQINIDWFIDWLIFHHSQGDSGGPLMLRSNDVMYGVGITSFGSATGCAAGDPVVYIEVSKYINWINEKRRNWCHTSSTGVTDWY